MKHNLKITLVLLSIFLLAQFIGIAVLYNYIDVDKSKKAGKTIFAIFKEDMSYSVLAHYPKRGIVRVLNALNFSRCYSVRIDKNLFVEEV